MRTVLLTAGGAQRHRQAIEIFRRSNVATDESHLGGAESMPIFATVRPHVSFGG